MKAEVEPIRITVLPAVGLKAVDYLELTKPKISAMVLVATLTGFYMAHQGPMDLWLLFNTLLGTALVGSGASGLNQVIEREFDARMLRTRNRHPAVKTPP